MRRSNRTVSPKHRIATRVAAVALVPAGIVLGTASVAGADVEPPAPSVSTVTTGNDLTMRLERLLADPASTTVADVEWLVTGGRGLTEDEIVWLVDRLVQDVDPTSAVGALEQRLAETPPALLASMWDHVRPMSMRDLQDVGVAIAVLDAEHVERLIARVARLAPADLDAFVATVAEASTSDLDLVAFFAFVSA